VNLELARLFIDQLIVLRTKTRGNLAQDEIGVLNNAISNLQMVFLEVSQAAVGGAAPAPEAAPAPVEAEEPVAESAAPAPAPEPAPAPAPAAEESKKKFSKSYGS
jgi:uncharacterized membrane protein